MLRTLVLVFSLNFLSSPSLTFICGAIHALLHLFALCLVDFQVFSLVRSPSLGAKHQDLHRINTRNFFFYLPGVEHIHDVGSSARVCVPSWLWRNNVLEATIEVPKPFARCAHPHLGKQPSSTISSYLPEGRQIISGLRLLKLCLLCSRSIVRSVFPNTQCAPVSHYPRLQCSLTHSAT